MSGVVTSTRVFIGKVGAQPRNELNKECAKYGEIIDFLMKDQYAFVEYSSESEAKRAVVELDGRCILGQRLIAEFAKPKQIDEIYFSMHPRMYIGRLNGDIKKRDIQDLFGKYGDIVDILMKDDFAFVEFKQPESAATAIKEMNGFQVGNTRLVVEVARPKSPEELGISTPRQYVGHVAQNVKKHDQLEMFKKYGDIVEIMMKDDFAFIEYAHIHSASKALGELNGGRLAGQKIQVEEARPKDGETTNHRAKPLHSSNQGNSMYGKKPEESAISRKRKIRMSPRRSMSRSRSRSQDKENNFPRF